MMNANNANGCSRFISFLNDPRNGYMLEPAWCRVGACSSSAFLSKAQSIKFYEPNLFCMIRLWDWRSCPYVLCNYVCTDICTVYILPCHSSACLFMSFRLVSSGASGIASSHILVTSFKSCGGNPRKHASVSTTQGIRSWYRKLWLHETHCHTAQVTKVGSCNRGFAKTSVRRADGHGIQRGHERWAKHGQTLKVMNLLSFIIICTYRYKYIHINTTNNHRYLTVHVYNT